MPGTGGGCTDDDEASWIAASRMNSSPWMAAADCGGSFARFSNGSSITNIAPAFGALVKVAPEKPTMLTACATPGIFSAMSTARLITSSVRSSEAPGGSCATTIR